MAAASQVEPPDKELLVCALDLISGMAEGLGEVDRAARRERERERSSSGTYLFACMKDPQADVRQSAFALVGDLAQGGDRPAAADARRVPAGAHVAARPGPRVRLQQRELGARRDRDEGAAEHVAPYVEAALQRLIPIVNRYGEPSLNKSLLENTAITIGRLGYAAAAPLAPHLGTFCRCVVPRALRDPRRRREGARVPRALRDDPPQPAGAAQLADAAVRGGGLVGDAAAAAPLPLLPDPHRVLGSIPPDQWAPFQAAMKPGLAQKLAERYGV